MKKLLCLILALVLTLPLCFAACVENVPPDDGDDDSGPVKLATPVVTIDGDGMASWQAVENAVRYAYKINDGAEKRTAATGFQLADGDSISVKAVGDGVNYSDSDFSAVKTFTYKSIDGWYVMTSKKIDGRETIGQFVNNTMNLDDGIAVWYEVDIGGANRIDGSYTVVGDSIRIRFGVRTYEFVKNSATNAIAFSGEIERKKLEYSFEKQEDYQVSDDKGEVAFTQELFGDDITKNFYNYCPSIMTEGRTMHIWYCSNKDDSRVIDYVAYRKGTLHDDGKWTFSDKQLVLQGTSGQWDGQHVCDPTVVKGEFSYKSEKYGYMMAYLGCTTTDNTKNEVGIAFAKNPEGPYVKADNVNPIGNFYKDFGLSRTDSSQNTDIPANKSWGYGQPSLISVDKKGTVILFYAKGTPKGTYTTAEMWDMSNADSPRLLKSGDVSEIGITNAGGSNDCINNADFAYDPVLNRLYCVKEDFPYPTDSGINWIAGSNTVFYMQLDGSGDGIFNQVFDAEARMTWTKVGAINQGLTGFIRNHNCGIVTDEYGWLQNFNQLPIVYTMSLSYNDFYNSTDKWPGGGQWPALHTYRLHGIVLDLV